MNPQKARAHSFAVSSNGELFGEMVNTIKTYLYHWPLFVLGIGISGTILVGYLRTIKPVYEVKASLLIQDEKKSAGSQSPLHELDLVTSSSTMENELEILKSKQIIDQVVSDLQLGVSYQQDHGFYSEDLYGQSPVKFSWVKPAVSPIAGALRIIPKDLTSFTLVFDKERSKDFLFNATIQNKLGTFKLESTPDIEKYIGSEIVIGLSDPDQLAILYQTAINTTLSSKTSTTVMLSVKDVVVKRGKDILNRLIYYYNRAGDLEKNRRTKNTLDFIDERLALLTDDLNEAEKGIETFKSSRGLTDLTSDSRISLENMQHNDATLNEVYVKLSVIEGIERFIRSSQSGGKMPATLGVEDTALSSLIEKLSQLQLQREKLLATTPETNPDFDPINRQISLTKTAIQEHVESIKSSLQNTRDKLEAMNSRFESSIRNIPVQERQFINIKRQQSIKESLYTYLLQKREEISVQYASAFTDNRIVDQAYSSPPQGKQKQIALIIAMLMGLGLPAGLIYARSIIKPKVTSLNEIEGQLSVPVICELSQEAGRNPIVVRENTATAISEQLRALRIKLHYLHNRKGSGRVTLITSSVSGEGKSFVSVNLATALAFSGRKTILLEMDLRKPKLAETFELDRDHPGISDYLKGTVSVTDIAQSLNAEHSLDIITSGTIVPNPSELLESEQLEYLIQYLRTEYDDIIIDTPPVHLVSDAMTISQLSDINLYMVRQGFTSKSELNFIDRLHTEKNLGNLNIIFNGINPTKYGYGYHYDQNYYNEKKKLAMVSMFSDFGGRF
jgi:tyrosine-protein kinase Etk/Wzc